MSHAPLKITFHLDGTGLIYDPAEPIHVDDLLAWDLAPRQGAPRDLTRADVPTDLRLPLKRSMINGSRVWHASALFPEGETGETVQFWRQRLRVNRIELTQGSPNTTNGQYRDWQMPINLLLVHRLVGYACGDRREVLKVLRRIPYLGKKRAHGWGKVVGVDVERIDEDWSLARDGEAMRYLPHPDGARLVRPAPPYWNPQGRVRCLDVGASL